MKVSSYSKADFYTFLSGRYFDHYVNSTHEPIRNASWFVQFCILAFLWSMLCCSLVFTFCKENHDPTVQGKKHLFIRCCMLFVLDAGQLSLEKRNLLR